jgi:SAM-dependent methyltransferase
MLFRDKDLDSKYKSIFIIVFMFNIFFFFFCKNMFLLAKPKRIVGDEEILPFEDNYFDLIISNMSLHWINDLPGLFVQAKNKLKPDGFLLASMFGEDTLYQLRYVCSQCEREFSITNFVVVVV